MIVIKSTWYHVTLSHLRSKESPGLHFICSPASQANCKIYNMYSCCNVQLHIFLLWYFLNNRIYMQCDMKLVLHYHTEGKMEEGPWERWWGKIVKEKETIWVHCMWLCGCVKHKLWLCSVIKLKLTWFPAGLRVSKEPWLFL